MATKLQPILPPEEEDQMIPYGGAPADFAGPVYPNPTGIEPKADTDPAGPVTTSLTGGAKMDTSNSDGNQMEIPGIEASAKSSMPPAPHHAGPSTGPAEAAPLPAMQPEQQPEDMGAIANGPTDQPSSILGDKVAPGAAIAPNQMHDAGKAQFHDTMRDFGAKESLNRASMLALNPNDPNYLQKLAAHEAQGGMLRAEKARYEQMHPWGSPESAHPGVLGKIGHVLGAVGNAAGGNALNIPGSQANLQEQVGLGEGEVKQGEDNALTAARPGLEQKKIDVKDTANDINQQKADQTGDKNTDQHAIALRKQGLKLGNDGQPVPLAPDELSDTERSALTLRNAQADAAEARKLRVEMQGDPQSPENQARAARIRVLAQNAGTAAGHLGLDKAKYLADYFGTDPEGNALSGVQTDDSGKPVGVKVSNNESPTADRLKKADLSQNLQFNAKSLKDLIRGNQNLFGKVAGRFTTAEQMIGSNDPAIQEMGMIVHNMAMANMGIHGMRSAEEVRVGEQMILNHFRNSPEATIGGIDEIVNSTQTFVDASKHGKKTAPTPQHPDDAQGTTFHVGSTVYTIPANKVNAFKKKYPTAVQK